MKNAKPLFSPSILFLLLTPFFFSSCLAKKMTEALTLHQKTISEAALSRAATPKKLDVVAETYVQVLAEALRYGSAKKAVNHVETFSTQNEKDLDTLFGEIGNWSGNLSAGEQLLFAGRLATKPYTRQLIDLIPKFKRKVNRRIQTFKFLSKLTNVVSPESLLDKMIN